MDDDRALRCEEHFRAQRDAFCVEGFHELLSFIRQPSNISKYENRIINKTRRPNINPALMQIIQPARVLLHECFKGFFRDDNAGRQLALLMEQDSRRFRECIPDCFCDRPLIVRKCYEFAAINRDEPWGVFRPVQHYMHDRVIADPLRYVQCICYRTAYGIELSRSRKIIEREFRCRLSMQREQDERSHRCGIEHWYKTLAFFEERDLVHDALRRHRYRHIVE